MFAVVARQHLSPLAFHRNSCRCGRGPASASAKEHKKSGLGPGPNLFCPDPGRESSINNGYSQTWRCYVTLCRHGHKTFMRISQPTLLPASSPGKPAAGPGQPGIWWEIKEVALMLCSLHLLRSVRRRLLILFRRFLLFFRKHRDLFGVMMKHLKSFQQSAQQTGGVTTTN